MIYFPNLGAKKFFTENPALPYIELNKKYGRADVMTNQRMHRPDFMGVQKCCLNFAKTWDCYQP